MHLHSGCFLFSAKCWATCSGNALLWIRLEICPVALRRTGSNTWEVNAAFFFTCHIATSLCRKINWLAITLSTGVEEWMQWEHLSSQRPLFRTEPVLHIKVTYLLGRTSLEARAFCLTGMECVQSGSDLGGCSS